MKHMKTWETISCKMQTVGEAGDKLPRYMAMFPHPPSL